MTASAVDLSHSSGQSEKSPFRINIPKIDPTICDGCDAEAAAYAAAVIAFEEACYNANHAYYAWQQCEMMNGGGSGGGGVGPGSSQTPDPSQLGSSILFD